MENDNMENDNMKNDNIENDNCNVIIERYLVESGCDEAFIKKYFELGALGECGMQMAMLKEYRKELLQNIHNKQKNLDCLDYFIFSLKNCCKDK